MKVVTIQWPDTANITGLVKGATVTVSDGTITIAGGIVVAITDGLDPVVPTHDHPNATVDVGPPGP